MEVVPQLWQLWSHPNFWGYVSMPFICAAVGWSTNVLALKMTFYPLEFIGIKPFLGWQGIIPSKARKMANLTVDMITTKLVGVEEVIGRLEEERIVEELQNGVSIMLRDIIERVVTKRRPDVWKTLPEPLKEEIYAKAAEDSREVIRESFRDILVDIEDILDLKTMAVEALMKDKRLINKIFQECGNEEFKFIERSGLWFGFLFGLVQAVAWALLDGAWWLLPAMGFVVGFLTNFLALKMIFEPRRPRPVGPVVWQGMFLKRQDEVSKAYAALITEHIVNTRNIIEAIFRGRTTDRLLEIIEMHVRESIAQWGGLTEPVIGLVLGSDQYEVIKNDVVVSILNDVKDGPIYDLEAYAEEAMRIEETLRVRLQNLAPEQFEGLLRPVFQEDEFKLILVGAALGTLVGIFQLVFIFDYSLF